MDTTKDWKFIGRVVLFIPAGVLAGICVRLAANLLRMFFAWRNPPSEYGNSFLEGGLLYFAFGTDAGRLYTLLIYSFISEIVAAIFTMLVAIMVFPNANRKIITIITFATLFFYALMLFMNFISLPTPSVFDVFIIKLFGGLCGVILLHFAWREETFDE